MAHFLCKLQSPRAGFPHDMTAAEAGLMREHAGYWMGLLEAGVVVAFGPVADPSGFWGLGLVEVDGEAEARALTDDDPVIRADAGFRYDLLPMPNTIARPAPSRDREPNPVREGRPLRA